jgi:general stress protein 26
MPNAAPYEERKAQVEAFLKSKHAISLATSQDDHVTVRTISFACRALEIVFLTFDHSLKCKQIRANPNVALCRDNVQIEGKAEILGTASDPEKASYADLLRTSYPGSFQADASRVGMVIVRVIPEIVKVFRAEGTDYLVDTLDLEKATLSTTSLADRES